MIRNALLILALAPLTLAVGCFPEPLYRFDPGYSMNVVEPNINKSNLSQLTPAQYKVYQKLSEPDYMRILWNKRGELAPQSYRRRQDTVRAAGSKERSWIYLDEGKEFFFEGDTGIEQKPLTDQIRTICEYGDPYEMQKHFEDTRHPYILFKYYDEGLFFKFTEDGRKIGEPQNFGRMRR